MPGPVLAGGCAAEKYRVSSRDLSSVERMSMALTENKLILTGAILFVL